MVLIFILLEVILMVLGLILYAFLRQSVRLISEAPDELLDERQIALRDANYSLAYRSIVPLIYAYGALLAVITTGGWLHDYINSRFWMGIALNIVCIVDNVWVYGWVDGGVYASSDLQSEPIETWICNPHKKTKPKSKSCLI